MVKRPVKKQIKPYNYRRKDGKLIRVPTFKRTYHIGRKKRTPAIKRKYSRKTMEGFRRFSELDWDGFAGAKEFADGSDPIICDEHKRIYTGTQGSVIMDGNGMGIIIDKGIEDTYEVFSHIQKFKNRDEALEWLDKEIETNNGFITRDYMLKNYYSHFSTPPAFGLPDEEVEEEDEIGKIY